jgi:hypothetical protein
LWVGGQTLVIQLIQSISTVAVESSAWGLKGVLQWEDIVSLEEWCEHSDSIQGMVAQPKSISPYVSVIANWIWIELIVLLAGSREKAIFKGGFKNENQVHPLW